MASWDYGNSESVSTDALLDFKASAGLECTCIRDLTHVIQAAIRTQSLLLCNKL